jgi:type II secretory pathway component PulF
MSTAAAAERDGEAALEKEVNEVTERERKRALEHLSYSVYRYPHLFLLIILFIHTYLLLQLVPVFPHLLAARQTIRMHLKRRKVPS